MKKSRFNETKNRKEAIQPVTVKPTTMEAILQDLTLRVPNARAFRLPNNNLSKFFKRDIEAARAEWIHAAKNDPEESLRRIESDFLKLKTKAGKLDFHDSPSVLHGLRAILKRNPQLLNYNIFF